MENKVHSLSVVVTTKNEESNIENCLLSVLEQRVIDIEINPIVIDNFSTDLTVELAKNLGVKTYLHGPERNAQRNFGLLEKSSGDVLLWLDADMILHPELVHTAMSHLRSNPEFVALTVPEVILGNGSFSKIRRFERNFYNGTPIDGSRFIRSSVFRKVNGFSTDWLHGPDDWDLDLKLKQLGKIGHLDLTSKHSKFHNKMRNNFNLNLSRYPIGVFHNESELSLHRHLQKKAYYSVNIVGYIKKWGKEHPDIKKQLGIRYRFFEVFFENRKWKKTLKHPHLYIGFFMIKFFVGLVYLYNKNSQKGG